MQKIFSVLSRLFEQLTGKKLLYITPSKHNALGTTAAWSELGFWNVGNVYDDADIAYGIAQNGVVEPAETRIVQAMLSFLVTDPSQKFIFYDVGANIGYYGLLAATQYKVTVESFEPLPSCVACIKAARLLNRCEETLTVHATALSDTIGTAMITEIGSGSSLVPHFNGSSINPSLEIKTTTIDDLVRQNTIAPPDFMMVDVEGHELSVLRGGSNVFAASKPVLFFEMCQSLPERSFVNEHYTETLEWLHNQGYILYVLTEQGALRLMTAQQKIAGIRMYLALHRDKHAALARHLQTITIIES